MSDSTRNWLIVAIVFVAGLGCVLRVNSAEEAKKPAVQKWEYISGYPEKLAELGKDGWELVACTSSGNRLYFQRPLQ